MKLTIKEFRKKTINTYPLLFRVCIFLRISKITVTDTNIWKNNSDFKYKIQEINPYNPLSYILLIVLLPIALLINGFNKENFNDIKKIFKN